MQHLKNHVLQDLQESEVCQDELALRVKQLKAELVLFKGLVSNVSLFQAVDTKYQRWQKIYVNGKMHQFIDMIFLK